MVLNIDAKSDFQSSLKKNDRTGIHKKKSDYMSQGSKLRNKPVVISLDVTYSSESEDENSFSFSLNEHDKEIGHPNGVTEQTK